MLKFSQYIKEARRSQSSVSPSRQRYIERMNDSTREGKFKSQLPKFSNEELDDHIANNFSFDLRDKVKRSSHDPSAPIDMTRPLPDSVKALARAAVYHFEDGVRKTGEGLKYDHFPTYSEGKKQIFAASKLMKSHVGEHFGQLMTDNQTRPILKKLISKEE